MSEWISAKNRLPSVNYDILGNWSSENVLLYFADGHFDIGYFNPIGVFEIYEKDGPAIVGSPRSEEESIKVVAWMPLPKPYEEK